MANQSSHDDLPDIIESTKSYEKWLSGFMDVSESGLDLKHADMATSPFIFLRATYYRWAQVFPTTCPRLSSAPELLSVGDLHVENFGTWRDVEGRLVWGVNDFDESTKLPYTNDLVRLAVSAKLSIEEDSAIPIHWKAACAAIAEGYGDAMADAVENISTVAPIVLAESDGWLAKIASQQAMDPQKFWTRLATQASQLKPSQKSVARAILQPLMPCAANEIEWFERSAGEGSLGRPRYVGVAKWRGGHIAREAKTLAPSAAHWAGEASISSIRYAKILSSAVRSPDPFMRVQRHSKQDWIVRRLSPDCHRIRMESLKDSIDDKLFHAMGHETANIHLNQPKRCRAVLEHFSKLGPGSDWLCEAAVKMEHAVIHDFDAWREHHAGQEHETRRSVK